MSTPAVERAALYELACALGVTTASIGSVKFEAKRNGDTLLHWSRPQRNPLTFEPLHDDNGELLLEHFVTKVVTTTEPQRKQ